MQFSSRLKLTVLLSSTVLLTACTIAPQAYLTVPQSNYFNNLTNEEVIDKSKKLISYTLKDPDSAIYRNFKVSEVSEKRHELQPEALVGLVEVLCVEVNAKNSYGGYTGYKGVVISGDGNIMPNEYYSTFCSSNYKTYRQLAF